MKLIYTTLLLSTLACSATEYINYIRESHFITGEEGETPHYEYHTDISNVDGARGKLGVLNKTVYDLFVIDSSNLTKEYVLDSKTVYTNAPSAELSIISDGPRTDEPRTRADKPFYVTFTVKSLTPESEIANPRYNSVVLMSETSNQRLTLSTISDNITANTVRYMPLPLMGGSDPTQTSGSIQFTINENAEVDADEFASQDIKILPKHVGSFSGIESGKRYFTLPNAVLELANMYPGSTAISYLYKDNNPTEIIYISGNDGGQVLSPKGDQTHSVTGHQIRSLDSYVTEKGNWTLVTILTETPWEDEIIDQVSFTKVTNIKVRANISTQK